MSTDFMNYNQMVEEALRGVLAAALRRVAEQGLPGNHHLYISFRTGAPGVEIPDYLQARYPEEMTIVLQHQYWGLEVEAERFAVTLSFNKVQERLLIPFAAVTGFADPSVQFGLQFRVAEIPGPLAAAPAGERLPAPLQPAAAKPGPESPAAERKAGEVVALDKFRKK